MAKNLNDFMNDLKQDDSLREALGQATSKDSRLADVIAFAAEKGYDFTEQDVEGLNEQLEKVSKEELRKVAGGEINDGGGAVLCIFLVGTAFLYEEIFG